MHIPRKNPQNENSFILSRAPASTIQTHTKLIARATHPARVQQLNILACPVYNTLPYVKPKSQLVLLSTTPKMDHKPDSIWRIWQWNKCVYAKIPPAFLVQWSPLHKRCMHTDGSMCAFATHGCGWEICRAANLFKVAFFF